jgi:membrane-associated phospholipid phosphatase
VIALVLALAQRRAEILIWALVADVAADLPTDALHWAFPRARPHLDPLIAVPHSHSFPSGHAATSFACATVLGAAAPRWRFALFVLAILIAWSRVYNGVHYPLDVFAGAILGLGVGVGLLRALPRLGAGRLRSLRVPRPG